MSQDLPFTGISRTALGVALSDVIRTTDICSDPISKPGCVLRYQGMSTHYLRGGGWHSTLNRCCEDETEPEINLVCPVPHWL